MVTPKLEKTKFITDLAEIASNVNIIIPQVGYLTAIICSIDYSITQAQFESLLETMMNDFKDLIKLVTFAMVVGSWFQWLTLKDYVSRLFSAEKSAF